MTTRDAEDRRDPRYTPPTVTVVGKVSDVTGAHQPGMSMDHHFPTGPRHMFS